MDSVFSAGNRAKRAPDPRTATIEEVGRASLLGSEVPWKWGPLARRRPGKALSAFAWGHMVVWLAILFLLHGRHGRMAARHLKTPPSPAPAPVRRGKLRNGDRRGAPPSVRLTRP
ncbi:Os04g0494701 [Oryza sativa Japonica Group]|uniref:Os04g0494701 protein n=1 Tax=Oryza sativa subsp. japonica TaxID=39947 RepID=A0A0N7KJA5_ORYSJ|nr:Os04g0494701 [Oryza sativa Japonica Group]